MEHSHIPKITVRPPVIHRRRNGVGWVGFWPRKPKPLMVWVSRVGSGFGVGWIGFFVGLPIIFIWPVVARPLGPLIGSASIECLPMDFLFELDIRTVECLEFVPSRVKMCDRSEGSFLNSINMNK